jgi:5-methylcytosine-specific restriction enzyme subunit McrC
MNSTIPIQNIYYLLCYAWNRLKEGNIVAADAVEATSLVDLFAKVLIGGVSHLIKRGLDRGYVYKTEDIDRLRGRIQFKESLRFILLRQPKANCGFDELNYDVLHNQILKETIRLLISENNLDRELKDQLIGLHRRLQGVENIPLNAQVFRRVQLYRNNQFYDFLIKVCDLIYSNLLPTEQQGKSKFRDFVREEHQMRLLFEAFVRNFYKIEQSEFTVGRENIAWKGVALDAASEGFLPSMQTDISMTSPSRKIVIECKFYHDALQTHPKGQRSSIHSENLYQLMAYLKNLEDDGINKYCEGILLYPTVGEDLDLRHEIWAHRVSVHTVNLNQDWRLIHNRLLRLIGLN